MVADAWHGIKLNRRPTLKIVFIITCLPVGGAEMALYRLLSRLGGDIEAHVISLREVDEVGAMIRGLGIRVESLGMVPSLPNPLAILDLAIRLRRIRPDLVQTWMYHADLLGGIATKLSIPRCPVVWSVRGNNLSPDKTGRTTLIVAKLCAWLSRILPKKVVFNSEAARALHAEYGYARHKCDVIANGLDLNVFGPDPSARASLRTQLNIPADAPLVGMFARFDILKNHQGFVQIARLLLSRLPRCRIVMAGLHIDGQNARLVKWIADAGIAESMHLLGPRRDMPHLMAAIDVLAMPSWAEAFPNVVAEAMACGVPCVVTAVGDAPDIVGSIGAVVPPGDAEAFAAALHTLLALPEAKRSELAMRARARAEQHYDLGVMAKRFEALYATLLPAAGAAQ